MNSVITALFFVVGSCWAQLDVNISINAGDTFNVDRQLDGILPQIGEYVRQQNLDTVSLPDMVIDGEPVMVGVQLTGLSKLVRRSEALVTVVSKDVTNMQATIGIVSPQASVYLSTYAKSNITWKFSEILLDVSIDLKNTPDSYAVNCYTIYKSIMIKSLGSIIQRSSNPDFDLVLPTKRIIDESVEFYNKWLQTPGVLGPFSRILDLCQPSKQSLPW